VLDKLFALVVISLFLLLNVKYVRSNESTSTIQWPLKRFGSVDLCENERMWITT
jgi:hypothetical protein